jgi:hypothetical protein
MRSAAVDNFLFDKPEVQQEVMLAIRDLIFALVKDVNEQLKWNCPFYSKDGMLCYINYDRSLRCVVLAFVEGFLLEDKYKALVAGTKNIRKLPVATVDSIDEKQIAYYLKQALKINKGKDKNFLAIEKSTWKVRKKS